MMFQIREAAKGDKILICTLVEKVLSDYGIAMDPGDTDKDLSDIEKYYFHNNGCFMVLEIEGELIGTYGIYRLDSAVCELKKMYLHRSYQGQGLGKLMLEDALQKARCMGYIEMKLETNTILFKALSLYKKYGFTETKEPASASRCNRTMILKL